MTTREADHTRLEREHDRRARFTQNQVEEMRELYAKGYTQKAIAEKYGTHQSTVSYIVSEMAHKNLAKHRKANPPKRRTKEEQREYMRDLRSYKKQIFKKENLI